MLSLAFIRANADVVRRAAELKGETAPVDEILRLDQEWRGHQFKAESIKAEQNELSKQFASQSLAHQAINAGEKCSQSLSGASRC